ncbi:nitroreductase/quinone reductase family protein [Pengzhenrongella sicca]|uniref:Nitroreductase family deazaflavin-dependent oxidoreductase n=1 Tax=Pengzhenrongella sicca TaxID=2819238 RepID=A0A8A4ZET2_9MICO|nr:nitroreductase/quinone reductase family protein [Pengzhenrongella sicca]QTE30492.1 nitroreductase family deazaflavin-dependent oxidoreductase [Pengzhenrongella sicca]
MSATTSSTPTLPPRWIIRTIWRAHRLLYRVTAGRLGLSRPTAARAGFLRLRTVGRTSGRERAVIVCYVEDGARLVTLAMNGWGAGAPAWWLNLQAAPDAEVDLRDGARRVHATAATGAERDRLWTLLDAVQGWGDDLDAMAALRPDQTTVVVLEPRVDPRDS